MKKRIIMLILVIFLTTGCTCEYNLTIDNNTYKEEIVLTSSDSEELTNFNNEWQIPTDKETYQNISGDPSTETNIEEDIYNYNLSGNKLKFDYEFTKNGISNSTAISVCYNTATIQSYDDSIIISTSDKVKCFDTYPPLTEIKINISTDQKVTTHNADSVNGNTYTWYITKEQAENRPINMIIKKNEASSSSSVAESISNNQNNKQKDYTLYIFCLILLIVLLLGYFIVTRIKKDKDDMDD